MPEVLLIDHSPTALNLLVRRLRDLGLETVVARDGTTGLAIYMDARPALTLVDLMLPGISGFDFIEEIRRNPLWQDVPLVVITAKDLTDAEREWLNARVKAIVRKNGLSREALADCVVALLQDQRGRSAAEASPAVAAAGTGAT